MIFGSPIDLLKQEIRNPRAQNLATPPSDPVPGQFYYNSAANMLVWWNGTAWINATGDTIAPGSIGTTELADGSVTNAKVATNAAIALSKLAVDVLARSNHTGTQAIGTILAANTARLFGRTTAGSGAGEEITVGGGLEFNAGGLRTTAFTGDVTKAAGGTALTIANAAVTNAKQANMTAGTIKGRQTGTGAPEDLGAAAVKAILALVAADISNFDTQVRTSRLDQMAAPTAAVSMNGQRVTGVGTPTADTDAATKAYADAIAQGIQYKAPVRVATTANITLSGAQTIDGVAVVAGNRVLVKNQSTATQNGIYIVAAGAWTRAPDADAAGELAGGTTVWVDEGTSQGNTAWTITSPAGSVTPGTTAHTWSQTSGLGQVTAGNGLTKSGNTLAVGQGAGITVAATTVAVATGGVTAAMLANNAVDLPSNKVTGILPIANGGTGAATAAAALAALGGTTKYAANFGNGSAQQFTITHNLGTEDVVVQIRYAAGTKQAITFDWRPTSANAIQINTGIVPATNEFRVVVIG